MSEESTCPGVECCEPIFEDCVVIPPAVPLEIVTSIQLCQTLCLGDEYNATVSATGGENPYTLSLFSGALPDGVTLNTLTGIISGTVTTAGNFTFTIRATDSLGATADGTYTIGVIEITTTAIDNYTVGVPYSFQMVAIGGSTNYAWSVISGILPDGLSMSEGGLITGTPTGISGGGEIGFQVVDLTCDEAGCQTQLPMDEVFYNAMLTETVECPPGFTGDPIVVTIEAGTYSSTESQEAADALAQSALDAAVAIAETELVCTEESIGTETTIGANMTYIYASVRSAPSGNDFASFPIAGHLIIRNATTGVALTTSILINTEYDWIYRKYSAAWALSPFYGQLVKAHFTPLTPDIAASESEPFLLNSTPWVNAPLTIDAAALVAFQAQTATPLTGILLPDDGGLQFYVEKTVLLPDVPYWGEPFIYCHGATVLSFGFSATERVLFKRHENTSDPRGVYYRYTGEAIIDQVTVS